MTMLNVNNADNDKIDNIKKTLCYWLLEEIQIQKHSSSLATSKNCV